jgi:hypothetical protein
VGKDRADGIVVIPKRIITGSHSRLGPGAFITISRPMIWVRNPRDFGERAQRALLSSRDRHEANPSGR